MEIIDSASEVSSDGGAYLNGSPGSEDNSYAIKKTDPSSISSYLKIK
jgi:hypothetical protein